MRQTRKAAPRNDQTFRLRVVFQHVRKVGFHVLERTVEYGVFFQASVWEGGTGIHEQAVALRGGFLRVLCGRLCVAVPGGAFLAVLRPLCCFVALRRVVALRWRFCAALRLLCCFVALRRGRYPPGAFLRRLAAPVRPLRRVPVPAVLGCRFSSCCRRLRCRVPRAISSSSFLLMLDLNSTAISVEPHFR